MVGSARFLQSYATTPLYNTKLVVGETGVPADTFRAWERRYGVPRPQRGEGGQRLYSARDIALIRWLRDRTNEGLTISQAVALLELESDAVAPDDQPRSLELIAEDLRQALLRFDAPTADGVLSEAFALYPLDSVCFQLIEPVLIDVGELWHAGHASVAQEHFASQFLRRKLLALINIYDVPGARATVIAACAAGELHDLGLLLLALVLARRNYRVVFLGADVPHDALQQAVDQIRPDVVCLSATTARTAAHAVEMAGGVMESHPEIIVGIGGQGIDTEQPEIDGIHMLRGNGVATADQLGSILAARRAR